MSYRRFPDINRRVLTELLPNRSFISPQTYPRAPLSRVYHLLEIPRSVVDTNDYTYRLQGRSSSRISPIDLSNRSRVVPTPTLPTHPPTYPTLPSISLVWTDIFKMIPADAGFLGKTGLPRQERLDTRKIIHIPFIKEFYYTVIYLYENSCTSKVIRDGERRIR